MTCLCLRTGSSVGWLMTLDKVLRLILCGPRFAHLQNEDNNFYLLQFLGGFYGLIFLSTQSKSLWVCYINNIQ